MASEIGSPSESVDRLEFEIGAALFVVPLRLCGADITGELVKPGPISMIDMSDPELGVNVPSLEVSRAEGMDCMANTGTEVGIF